MQSVDSSKTRMSPYIIIIFGILAVSSASILIRYAQQDAPSLVIAFFRLSIATLLISPAALISYRGELIALFRRGILLALLSGLFLGFHFATWITSLEYTSVTSSVVLVATSPFWVALVSPLLLKEKMTRTTIIGLVLSLAGAILVGTSKSCLLNGARISCDLSDAFSEKAMLGNFLALAGAWLSAGYIVVGRKLRPSLSLAPYTFLVYGIASVVLAVMVFINGLPITGYLPETWLWFFLLAIFPQMLGHTSFNYALRFLPATFVSVTLLGEPIGTTILAMLVLREKPLPAEMVGGVLILIGILVCSRIERRDQKKSLS